MPALRQRNAISVPPSTTQTRRATRRSNVPGESESERIAGSGSTGTTTAVSTAPGPPLRRSTRASTHFSESPLPTTSASASASPTPAIATPSSSSEAETETGKGTGIKLEDGGDMLYSRDGASRRGTKMMEDITDFEEKGLLRSEHVGDDDRNGVKGGEKWRAIRAESEESTVGAGLSSKRDKEAFALLVVLYLLQGVPLGLTFGTLPFLLKPHLSYSQLAVFALATWPYSLKLLWSPIVDAWFVPKWGRRKSWIVPVQTIVAGGLWVIGSRIEGWLAEDEIDVRFFTGVFGSLILAAATQDIAVDGWALTLLSPPNLSYASTAQTIGLGIGSALAFTVFLAFNSADFSNKYFRSNPLDYGLISLGGYLRFWAILFLIVTLWLAFVKKEDPVSEDDPDMDVKKVYKVMWSIVKLKNIQAFLAVHLVCKIGFQVNDSVTSLKLLEKGLSREDLAVAVLLDFPAQMVAGWLAAKWSRPTSTSSSSRHALSGSGSGSGANSVLKPWIYAFWARLGMAVIATLVVWGFPKGPVGSGYFGIVIATTLFSSLASTVQFVGITAFHTQIADPLIGGTYMTLLNTVSNLGGTWPKPLILRSVDVLTTATCMISSSSKSSAPGGSILTLRPAGTGECVSEVGKLACSKAAGTCVVQRDGYYIMSAGCVILGAVLLVGYILPTVKRLQGLPMSAWRVKIPN